MYNVGYIESVWTEIDRLCGLVVRVSGYRSWGPGFDSLRYQFFWEVVGLERGPLSLVRITEELLEWKSSGSGQEIRINDRGDPLRWPRDTLYPQKLALTSPTSGGRSVGIVRLRTKDHRVSFFYEPTLNSLDNIQCTSSAFYIIFIEIRRIIFEDEIYERAYLASHITFPYYSLPTKYILSVHSKMSLFETYRTL
jgi:hypothetical protein